MQFTLINPKSGPSPVFSLDAITQFLYDHLEQYGDEPEAIRRCLDYAMSNSTDKGGFILVGHDGGKILGVTVINKTGMKGYIPENILVYIATHKAMRGKGIGKQLMQHAIKLCEGDVALHVEKDNPARFLYEKLGFTNPYLEMRLKR